MRHPIRMESLRIVAIGGGDIGTGETLEIDRRIVELAGEASPRALFLPTASFDAPDYFDRFNFAYREALACETEVAYLWEGYAPEEIASTIQATKWDTEPHVWEFRGDLDRVREAIDVADLIYVGGGNTKRMIELWRSAGIDQMLREAASRGTVLSGLSAGCICWARYGNSDFALSEGLGRPTGRVDGLDYLPISLCPHMSREEFRLEEFRSMMRETPGIGLGLDDGCALEYVDGRYRIFACIPGALAHLVTATGHSVIQPIGESRAFAEFLAG